jgi:dienelactone hydrolase
MRWKRVFGILIVAAAAAGGWWYSRPAYKPVDPALACRVGIYRLDDGRLVDLSPLTNSDSLRWRLLDGRAGRISRNDRGGWKATKGWSSDPDPMPIDAGSCANPVFVFDGHASERLSFAVTDTRFKGAGEELAGRLVLPSGDGPVPIAVLVHGSESYSALTYNYFQRLLPAHGIGVFVYDKRGTGTSTGRYSQDFSLLANDAVAALKEARRLAGARAGRVGFSGGSQAGWIAPLAATRSDADFVAVSYGLADSPLAEDRDQVMLDLSAKGHGPEVLAKAREVTDATGAIIASGFETGYDTLRALEDKYAQEPWWKDMKGEFTGDLVSYPAFALRWIGPLYDEGTTWNYDPLPVLHALKPPLLWILAGADREAPPDETRRRLLGAAQHTGRLTLVEYPDTDHGIVEFETLPDGSRRTTRVADGYFRLLIDWIRDGRLSEAGYGKGKVLALPVAGSATGGESGVGNGES